MTSQLVQLRLSNDRKVSPIVRRQGSKDQPRVANTFGLPAGVSCPGMTQFCVSSEGVKCYAANLENAYRSAGKLVASNYDALLSLGDDVPAMATALGAMVDGWRAQSVKLGADLVFRIHWDGDFYSVAYAKAWRKVIDQNPDVTFWAYTRSFTTNVNVVPALYGAENLSLYLSVDRHNATRAQTVLKRYPNVRVAVCAETQSDARVIADKLERSAAPCPENVGKLPLVVAGSGRRTDTLNVGDDGMGACIACGLCVYGRRDVGFATAKR